MGTEKKNEISEAPAHEAPGFISNENKFLSIACKSCIDSLKHPYNALTSIIFSCIYLEGFINTLKECISFHLFGQNDDMMLLHEILETLENARESLKARYSMIPLILSKKTHR